MQTQAMTNQQAASKAKRRYGKRFYVRAGESFSSPERREKARDTVVDARAEVKRIDEEITRRLSVLDWYQDLRKQRSELTKRINNTEGNARYYRFHVGKSGGLLGSGDTWEEAFAQADKRAERAA